MRNTGIRKVLKYEAVTAQLERKGGRDNVIEDDGSLVETVTRRQGGREETQKV